MDFVYVCKKQPFAITCSPYLPKIRENYVDMDLVLKMNIPMKNIQCTRINYAGQFTRIVGQISQTVQCVVSGKAKGTAHLKAKVVRDLSKLFHADCLAGQQLYDKLMDPTSPTTMEDRDNSKTSSKQIMNSGRNDTYTNVSTILVNETTHDDSEDSASDASHDAEPELANFLASMTEDARAQAVADYPELASHIKQGLENENSSTEDDLVSFLATQTEEFRSQAEADYPELAPILQTVQINHISPVDPTLAEVARQGLGPTDAYIMSINANIQPNLPIIPKPVSNTRLVNAKSTVSALSYPSSFASDLESNPPELNNSLNNLMTEHGYNDQEVPEQYLAASHGYDDSVPSPDCDKASMHSDDAEYFCRLCKASGQSITVTYSHNLLDPACPSMDYDDPFEEEDA